MDLDDQLSALAAGELGDDEARALRARVVADPALARRLERFERLDEVLTGWDVPPMDDTQRAALDEAVTAALDRLDDGPLVDDGGARVVGLRPLRDDRDHDREESVAAAARSGAAAAAGGAVVDLGAARERRTGIPTWASGLVAAAAALAVVGTIGVGLGGVGGSDDAALDVAAMESDDGGEEMAEDTAEAEMADEAAVSSEAAGDGGAEDAADTDTGTAAPGLLLPIVVEDVGSIDAASVDSIAAQVPPAVLERGLDELAAAPDRAPDELAERSAVTSDVALAGLGPSDCLDRLLGDVPPTDVLLLVGEGTYEARPALALVRLTTDGGDPVLTTTVHETPSCELVADATERR